MEAVRATMPEIRVGFKDVTIHTEFVDGKQVYVIRWDEDKPKPHYMAGSNIPMPKEAEHNPYALYESHLDAEHRRIAKPGEILEAWRAKEAAVKAEYQRQSDERWNRDLTPPPKTPEHGDC
jgi:hypothetical protein